MKSSTLMSFRKTAIVLNGFLHDFMTGYWLSALIAITFLHRFQQENPPLANLLGRIEHFFFWNSVGATFVILATGAGRTFTYVDQVFGADTEQTRRKMLAIKHVILLTLFGAGTWYAWRLTFH
jgi:uncharacterized membrane protein